MTGTPVAPTVITTVTLNPAIDEAISVDVIVLGGLNRVQIDALDPGGKGLNASRVISRLGRRTVALGFLGGVTGGMIRTRLDAEGVPHDFDDVPELTRINVMVYERKIPRRTRLYLPGATVDPARLAALEDRLLQLPPGSVVILAGSVPPGLSQPVYRDLVVALRARGIRPLVDASGPALEAVLGAHPELVKPNVEEVTELLGRTLRNDGEVLDAARELRARGPENVVISQGADGAIALAGSRAWKAIPPKVVERSTIGSGDSMMAGLAIALAEGRSLEEGLRLGTAAGAATAMVPGTRLCAADQVTRLLPLVRVHALRRDEAVRALSGGPSPLAPSDPAANMDTGERQMAEERRPPEPPEPLEPSERRVTDAPAAFEPPPEEEDAGVEPEPYFAPTDPVVDSTGYDIEFLGGLSDTSMESVEAERSAGNGEPGDGALAEAVRRELHEDATTTALDIRVEVRGGVARLFGTVPYPEDADQAAEVAERVPGIREVLDLLNVTAAP